MLFDRDGVVFDFIADWHALARNELHRCGYENIPNEDSACSLAFFETRWRRIVCRPREVEVAPEFQVPHHLEEGFQLLRKKFEEGVDVTPHMSRKIWNASSKDMFLNDWRIHHFHLGTVPHPKKAGFVHGTKDLALAWVTDEVVHFVKLGSHGADVGNRTWGDIEILDIVDRNWPRLLDRYDVSRHGWLPDDNGEPPATADEIVMMRRFTTIRKLASGRAVLPPGGGNMMAGNSSEALRAHDRILNNIQHTQETVTATFEHFLGKCAAIGHPLRRPIRLHLRIRTQWEVEVDVVDADGLMVIWSGLRRLDT